ncbi:MAG: hypothetical protein LLG01_04870 [Planctomycetaceae bacterium]|nr:hypothetical protein [Planctomycetaceae bacterium]
MMKRVSVPVAVLVLTAGAALAEPAPAPSVIELIQTIHNATDVLTASKAYAEARKADKNDPQIYKIFIQRMLEMGQPLQAAIPAAELTAMEGENGLAWGVVGYAKTRTGRIAEAFAAMVNAAKFAGDNEGIMFNAGVLCAWQDNAVLKGSVPPDAASTASSLKSEWSSKKGFAEGEKAALAIFKTRQDYIKSLQDKLTKLKSDIKDAQDKNKELADQFNVLKRRSDALEQRMRTADDTVRRYNWEVQHNGASVTQLPSYVTQAQSDYRQARDELAGVVRQGNLLRQAVAVRERAIYKAQQEADRNGKALAAFEKCDPTLPWKPPAVNGVIAADASAKTDEPSIAAEPTTKPASLPDGQRRLTLAKMLIENNQRDKAIKELLAIIQQYPDSEIARQAQTLLDTITL